MLWARDQSPSLPRIWLVENLTRVMAEADSGMMRQRARTVGQRIRSENGIDQTIKWIGKYSNNFHT
jgi:hypothetical protein